MLNKIQNLYQSLKPKRNIYYFQKIYDPKKSMADLYEDEFFEKLKQKDLNIFKNWYTDVSIKDRTKFFEEFLVEKFGLKKIYKTRKLYYTFPFEFRTENEKWVGFEFKNKSALVLFCLNIDI